MIVPQGSNSIQIFDLANSSTPILYQTEIKGSIIDIITTANFFIVTGSDLSITIFFF